MKQSARLEWTKTRWGHGALGTVSLLVAYGLASLAIDTAFLWAYAVGVVAIIYGVRQLVLAVKG